MNTPSQMRGPLQWADPALTHRMSWKGRFASFGTFSLHFLSLLSLSCSLKTSSGAGAWARR